MSSAYIPNTAAIPNVLFDYWMSQLNGSAFKILMAIARKTYGWRKEIDSISVRQLEELTGLGRSGIIDNLNELVKIGLVTKIKSKTEYGDSAANKYILHVDCSGSEIIEGIQNSVGGSPENGPPVVQNLDQGSPKNSTHKTQYTKPNNTKEIEADEPPAPAQLSKKNKKAKDVPKTAYRENIFLTEEEHKKLLDQYGPEKLNWMLDHLHAKKGAKGYDYDSDYHVLLPANWVNKEFENLKSQEKLSPKTSFEDHEKLAKKIIQVSKARSDVVPGYNYLEFINGPTSAKYLFGDKDFKENCLHQLRKRNIPLGDL